MTDKDFAELLMSHADTNAMDADADNEELLHLRAALSTYRHETLQWAERRSAVQPSLAEKAKQQDRWTALPQWALATVALVTIVGGVAHLYTGHESDTLDTSDTASMHLPAAEHTATAAELAEDNHLLSSIDAALSYHGASPVDQLDLRENHAAGSARVAEASN